MPYSLSCSYPTQAQANECIPVVWAEVSGIGEKPSLPVFLQALWIGYGYSQSKGFPVDATVPMTANPKGLLKEHMAPYFPADGNKPHAVANINWGVWGQIFLKILLGIAGSLPVPPAQPAVVVDASGLPALTPPLPEPNAFPSMTPEEEPEPEVEHPHAKGHGHSKKHK